MKKGVTERLYSGDNIVFGAEVARGDGNLHLSQNLFHTHANVGADTFLPVEVSVAFTWSDG